MFHIPGYSGSKATLLVGGYPDAKLSLGKVQDFIRDSSKGSEIDIAGLVVGADAFIDGLKTPAAARADKFRADLGRLLDDAKDIGVDVAEVEAIVNPLTVLMQQLSKNIIEHQPIAAE
jgi:hypothetical protein